MRQVCDYYTNTSVERKENLDRKYALAEGVHVGSAEKNVCKFDLYTNRSFISKFKRPLLNKNYN